MDVGANLAEVFGPEISFPNVVLASLAIVVLLVAILGLKWSAPRGGALAWLIAGAIALVFFGADVKILAIASAKGLSLSVFVLAIIWSAVLLYNVMHHLGGVSVIGATMTRLVGDPLTQALVVGWAFSGFMQGIAGFGVPVAIVTPLLVLMGFSPVKAVAIVLVGHAWSVTFGSLGSSYYTIQLVTGIDGGIIGPHMALMFSVPIILTGFAVAHLQGGIASIKRGGFAIVIMGGAMSFGVWATAYLGVAQIGSIIPGLIGCILGFILSRLRILPNNPTGIMEPTNDSEKSVELHKFVPLKFHMAFLPYYLLILFSLLSQLPQIISVTDGWEWGLDYPAMETSLGFITDAQPNYARIRFLRHPAPLILLSLIVSYTLYVIFHRIKLKPILMACRATYFQSISSSVGIITMVMMAIVMTDTGMTALLGKTIAMGTELTFPVFSPYIGLLGTFMTGSNTNSNVMFGALQLETANALGIGAVTIASAQSIGGSLGSAIAPAKVLVGTTIAGLMGRENEVLRRTIPYCLGIVFFVGIETLVLIHLFSTR
jgi:lactate permease